MGPSMSVFFATSTTTKRCPISSRLCPTTKRCPISPRLCPMAKRLPCYARLIPQHQISTPRPLILLHNIALFVLRRASLRRTAGVFQFLLSATASSGRFSDFSARCSEQRTLLIFYCPPV